MMMDASVDANEVLKRLVTRMRKIVLLLILACLFVCPAALADTVSFDDFSAQCKIAEDLLKDFSRL